MFRRSLVPFRESYEYDLYHDIGEERTSGVQRPRWVGGSPNREVEETTHAGKSVKLVVNK